MRRAKRKVRAARAALGIDLGGTKILAAVVAPGGRVLSRAKVKTRADEGPKAVIARLVACAREAVAAAGLDRRAIRAAGIGCPGPLDPDRGVVLETPNLPGWRNVPLARLASRALRLPAFISNDVRMGTLGEHLFGAAKGARNALGVFVGTGIGGGLVVDGRLYHGSTRNAGEIGHVNVMRGGPRCGCGRRGCLESVASRTAIVREVAALCERGKGRKRTHKLLRDQEKVSSRDLKAAVDDGDKMVAGVIRRAARRLGACLGGAINLLGPEVIVVGGGLVEAFGEDFVRRVRKAARKSCLPSLAGMTRVVAAARGEDAGALGAAAMALDRVAARRERGA